VDGFLEKSLNDEQTVLVVYDYANTGILNKAIQLLNVIMNMRCPKLRFPIR